jgi:type II secretory pathway pseudopilin PulG
MVKKNKGFTLIEILIIVAIITCLVSAVLVSLMSSINKAKDNSAFTSFQGFASPAFLCLTTGSSTVRLVDPPLPWHSGANICSDPVITSTANWPDFSRYGWTTFNWCSVDSPVEIMPAITGPYSNGTIGGDRSSGLFCFMLRNPLYGNKAIWCTMEGCNKKGF